MYKKHKVYEGYLLTWNEKDLNNDVFVKNSIVSDDLIILDDL